MGSESHDPDALPEMASLPRGVAPDAALEDRTAAALRSHGLLRAPASRRPWLQAAAAVLIFAVGAFAGRVTGEAGTANTATDQPRFLLLLHGEVDARGASEAELVDEYREWAIGLRRAGRQVSGERLGARRAIVPAPAAMTRPDEEPRGFFLITAPSLEDARAVAEASPHARRGGRIVVRPILPS